MHKGIFKTIGVILVAGILLAPTIGYVQGKDPKDIFLDFVEKIKKVDEKIKTLDQEIADLLAKLGDKSGDSSTPPVDKPSKPPTTDITIDPEHQGAIDKLREEMKAPKPVKPKPKIKITKFKVYQDPKHRIYNGLNLEEYLKRYFGKDYKDYFEIYNRAERVGPNETKFTFIAELRAAMAKAEALRSRSQSGERSDLDHEDLQSAPNLPTGPSGSESEPQVSVPKSPTIIIYSGPNCSYCTNLKNTLDQRYSNYWQTVIDYRPNGPYPKFVDTIPYIIINGVRVGSPGLMQELDKLKDK